MLIYCKYTTWSSNCYLVHIILIIVPIKQQLASNLLLLTYELLPTCTLVFNEVSLCLVASPVSVCSAEPSKPGPFRAGLWESWTDGPRRRSAVVGISGATPVVRCSGTGAGGWMLTLSLHWARLRPGLRDTNMDKTNGNVVLSRASIRMPVLIMITTQLFTFSFFPSIPYFPYTCTTLTMLTSLFWLHNCLKYNMIDLCKDL